ncbi:hypothetical protein BY996DRAFT_4584500, partial [Phakopsora pachyrhizi]
VLLQPMKEDPEPGAKCLYKFLVQSTFITPERESRPFDELIFLCPPKTQTQNALFRPSDQKGLGSQNSLAMINHTNRDKDDDCWYNTVRSPANSTLNIPSSSPVHADVVAVETTVYDMAHNKTFLNWSSHLPPPATPHKVTLVLRNNSASGYNSLNGQSSSSHLSHTTGNSLGINVNGINPGDEIDKLKSQLAIAFAEVEWLENQLKVQDKGLRKCYNVSKTTINHVNGADMIDLSPHGLKQGLVPVQTVVFILNNN